jgi:hypothetical protein
MKISYTDSGKNELEQFKKRQIQLLEDIVSQKKYVFGDDLVEVTASDVRDAGDQIRPVPRIRSRSSVTAEFLPKFYIAFGVLTTLGGIAWPYLRELKDQPQFIFALSGVLMTFLGVLMQLYFRYRARRYMDYEALQHEKILGWEYARLKKEVNQPVQPTITTVRSPAAQEPRQP